MFFLRKKKRQKDLGAGLVFRWRGARRHHMGKILAIAITGGFFAFFAYVLRVEGLKSPLLTQRKGVVVMLNNDDPYCQRLMEQVESRSPFPVRWDPAFDPLTMNRVKDEIAELDGSIWDYRPALVPLPKASDQIGLPSIMEKNVIFFQGSVAEWDERVDEFSPYRSNHDKNVKVRVLIEADEGIQKRLSSEELLLPDDLIADEWFGQTFRFLVGVDARGVFRGCLPLSGGSMEVVKPTEKQKFLAAWLRRMTLQPSDRDALMIGVLELQIEARVDD